jgi:hypothetical protein
MFARLLRAGGNEQGRTPAASSLRGAKKDPQCSTSRLANKRHGSVSLHYSSRRVGGDMQLLTLAIIVWRASAFIFSVQKQRVMLKERKGSSPPGLRFWLFMACCALAAITLIALLIGGEIHGQRVAPNIEHRVH